WRRRQPLGPRDPGPPPPPPGGPRPDAESAAVGVSNNPAANTPARTRNDGRSRDGGGRPRRPPWLRGLSESEYQSLVEKRVLHDLVLAMSIESFHAASARDLWLPLIIVSLAAVSALGSGLAWRPLVTSSHPLLPS